MEVRQIGAFGPGKRRVTAVAALVAAEVLVATMAALGVTPGAARIGTGPVAAPPPAAVPPARAAASPAPAVDRAPLRAAAHDRARAADPDRIVWQWPRRAWVSVPVATVWNHPATDRPVDAAEMSPSPRVDAWIGAMDTDQKLALDDLLATQALLDDPVTVVAHRGAWIRVLVDDQRGGVYPLGIAGWMPAGQVTYRAPAARPAATATVAVPRLTVGRMTVSYGTRLPVVAAGPAVVTVATATGPAPVPAGAVRTSPLTGSGAAVVAEAERFLGLPYLWAGTSAFGYDCSGLTYSVYRQFGIVLPRDAEDQARMGRPVARADLQPGDLVFFTFGLPTDRSIDHVGIYAGGGMLIHAPHTGASVGLVPLSALDPWWGGARRVLPG